MRIKIIMLILVLSCLATIPGIVQEKSSYPEFLEVTLPFEDILYAFTPDTNNATIKKTFSIDEFRDVTMVDLLLEQSGSLISKVTMSVALNSQNATNIISESTLYDQEHKIFILDDQAMLLPKPTNTLTISITVTFKNREVWDLFKQPYYSLRFDAITIKTVYRQSITESTDLNQTNSHFTALLVNPEYQLATNGFLINSSNTLSLFAYDLVFYIILPKDIKSNYYLNLTFSYTYGIDIRSIFIENFGLQSSTKNDNSITYTFRYIDNKNTKAIAKGDFQFNPKTAGQYTFDLTGNYFITNNYKLFPGGPEMDFFLFINATIIFPLLFLSKIIYRRLLY